MRPPAFLFPILRVLRNFYFLTGTAFVVWMVLFDGNDVSTGDAAKLSEQPTFTIRARQPSEVILVEVPLEFEPAGIWRGRI